MGGCGGYVVGGWSDTDNRAISVQLNLTGTATGTELCNMLRFDQDMGVSSAVGEVKF